MTKLAKDYNYSLRLHIMIRHDKEIYFFIRWKKILYIDIIISEEI